MGDLFLGVYVWGVCPGGLCPRTYFLIPLGVRIEIDFHQEKTRIKFH